MGIGRVEDAWTSVNKAGLIKVSRKREIYILGVLGRC